MLPHSGSSSGHWGPVTATLDWCEANYQFSRYVAEISNTFSNVFFIGISLYGAHLSTKESLPARYLVGFAGCALVGLGSFFFHATLLYEAQLADELPMIYVASFLLAMLLESEPGFGLKSTYSKLLIMATVIFDISFTASYLMYRNPVYHQCVFATLMVITLLRSVYLLLWSEASRTIPDKRKTAIIEVLRTGAFSFLIGFLIWNLDNIFCVSWTRVKEAVGWPTAFFMEGHAWWHIFTGLGTFYLNQSVTMLMLSVKDDHHKYRMSYWLCLPLVVRTSKPDKAKVKE
ncbi:ceramidase [Multifurca ochricompacta]|uniref:Ceramidase n=1 Tax=Multifurca ochricompacta TaxID=376703 RepID=A0AAD4QJA2_9AGAM|nr:ceramidase [Multifurca ochricompacta]